jgi:hypothetical protein
MSIASNFPAIKPTLLLDFSNTKELDSRVTFTRASTATYYGTQTAKAEENLLTYSQEFDNAVWGKTNATVTANTTTAPDGTTTADTMTATAATGFHIITAAPTSLVVPSGGGLSFFAKAGTASFVQLFIGGTAVPYANFDLSTGAVSGFGAGTTASIVDAGGGWYRCQLVTTTTAANSFQIGIITNISAARAESWTAAGTETVLIWGAQAENRQVVTAYTPTTTQPITNYIPQLLTAASGVARFDHNPTTFESLGLLIEEQRTNLLLRSEEFDNASWTKGNTDVASNAIVAPNGSLVADKLYENTATSTHRIFPASGISITTGVPYTYTIYAKAGERSRFRLANNSEVGAIFDLLNGSIVETSAGFTSSIAAVGNGWFRCSVTETSTASATGRLIVLLVSTGTTIGYTGDGYSGIYIWGAQLEAGAFPTSYIQTVASQVTRAADAASMTGTNFSSWYNQAAGTVYSEASSIAPAQTAQVFGISDGSVSNRIVSSSTTVDSVFIAANGVVQASLNTSVVASNVMSKLASAFAINDVAVSRSGASVVTDTSALMPVVNRMFIGNGALGSGATLNGHIRNLAYYPIRCTNAQLQGLTT